MIATATKGRLKLNKYMIHNGGEAKYARTLLRVPEANKFDRTELVKIVVTPWDLHVPREAGVIFKDKKEVADDNPRGRGRQPPGQGSNVQTGVHKAE